MSNRRVVHGGGVVIGLILALLLWLIGIATVLSLLARPVHAQSPQRPFYIFADTAGVSAIGDSVYITWVFAKATPTSLPSSGVLVGFDCKAGLVQRYAHVVYEMASDSSGVTGPIVVDTTGWVPMSNPELFKLVCSIGPTHVPLPILDSVPVKPQSPYFQS